MAFSLRHVVVFLVLSATNSLVLPQPWAAGPVLSSRTRDICMSDDSELRHQFSST